MTRQTQQALDTIEENLRQADSDKQSILSAKVYLADITQKPAMDAVWRDWIGDDPDHWPQRACLGVDLEADVLVEITVIAVRQQQQG
jgi:enamine deaminase RidA (YjgF/YER057c/UK114 family)